MLEQLDARFRSDCGFRLPLRLKLSRAAPPPNGHALESAESVLEFPSPTLLIGRGGDSDCVLEDESISRRHALVQLLAGRVLVIDLDSRSGLRWDGGKAPWG